MKVPKDHPIIFLAKVLALDLGLNQEARDRFVRLVKKRAIEEELMPDDPPADPTEAANRTIRETERLHSLYYAHLQAGGSPASFSVPERARKWLEPNKMVTLFNDALQEALADWSGGPPTLREAYRRISEALGHDPVTDTFY